LVVDSLLSWGIGGDFCEFFPDDETEHAAFILVRGTEPDPIQSRGWQRLVVAFWDGRANSRARRGTIRFAVGRDTRSRYPAADITEDLHTQGG